MKKIITLLLATAIISSVFAQSSDEKARAKDKVFGNHKGTTQYPNGYPTNYPSGSREAAIDQVNREYDQKIASVQNNPYLSASEKDSRIRQLNQDRQRRIDEINRQYGANEKHGKRKNKHHDDDDDSYKNEHHDNGKHLGWEKGVGNPHKGKGKNWKD
ncbi:MAG: hypothetical protein C4329_03240 [Chitinophagaceae bacterium]